MSNNSGSIQLETIVIILCVVGVFAAAVIYAARSNIRRAAMMREFAESRGWSFSRTDTEGLAAKIDALFPDEKFSLENIMAIENSPRAIRLFDCGYRYRERRSGGSFGTGCSIASPRFASVGACVEIIARSWVDAATLGDQVAVPDPEFSRSFIVISQDREAAQRAVTEALRYALVAHSKSPLFNPVRIGLGASGAVVLTGLNAEPERWADLAELARAVESSMP